MNTILQQICENFICDITTFFGRDKIVSLVEMETSLKKRADNFILEMMKAYMEQLDQAIVDDKSSRKKEGIVVERRADKRELYTMFGHLSFARTYFYDKKNKEYAYLLDKAVGLESYERVSNTVAIELVEHASESSYGESSRHVTGGQISRQTVMRKLRKLEGLKVPIAPTKRQVKVLYVNADEDHISLQNGKNSIVPLISIHEGIARQGKRGRCINPHYISSYGKDPEELWLETAKWIYQSYDENTLEAIYLHGDGASWIKTGLDWLPEAKFVLDRYHLNEAVITATGRQQEKRFPLYKALYTGDKASFIALANQLKEDATDESEKERIRKFTVYVKNNWAGIAIYSQEDCGGSCTEGHVSHVLSSRLSSRPMGWGREGLRVMAELRAFKSSGGEVKVKHLGNPKFRCVLTNKMIKRANKSFKRISKEQFNNVKILSQGKIVPVFDCLRGLQHGRTDL